MELANNYYYKLNNNIYSFSKLLQNFIINSNPGVFESLCHDFHSTSQIKNWLKRYFLSDEMEIVDNNDNNNHVEEYNNDNYKLPEHEKIELDIFKRREELRIDEFKRRELKVDDLQQQLELLAKKEESNSIKSSELELNKVIEDCNVEKIHKISSNEDDYYERSLYITDEQFANKLVTCVNDDYNYKSIAPMEINYNDKVQNEYFDRSPIFPSTNTNSINNSVNSVFEAANDILPPTPKKSVSIEDNNETNV
jgi:DNA mismatch repair ATPase MutS